MAGMRMSMRKIREVLRLTHELGLSVRDVCEATGVGKTAVCEYVNRARVIGITWPIPPLIDDAGLERRLFTPAGFHAGSTKPLPDWTKVHEELKRRSVTLMILWEEHRAEHVDGHGYSRFCELYGAWRKRLSPTMRQTYVAGEQAVRRLGWRHGADHRSDDGRGARGAPLRRRARRVELHLCRGDAGRDAARLDWRARQRVRLLRRRAEASGARQSQSRHHQAVASTSRASTAPIRTSPTITASSCCRRAYDARATRRAFHTAPHSDYCAVIRSSRAGCGRRPPWPLMIFRLGGMSQSPRRRRSE